MDFRWILGDTETTGASDDSRVCEIAWAELNDSAEVIATAHSLIDPEVPICPSASGIHHITNAMVADAPTMEEFFGQVLGGNPLAHGDVVLIAHNVKFDKRFFAPWIGNLAGEMCTLRLARKFFPDAPNHKLDTLRYYLDLPVGNTHRADEDVITTVALLERLMHVSGLNMHELMFEANQLQLIRTMPFGKHKDKTFEHIFMTDRSYLNWALGKLELEPDMRHTMQSALKGEFAK